MEKTFGDKVHSFLRKIGIKESNRTDVTAVYDQLTELAKQHGRNYQVLYLEIGSFNGVQWKGYIDARVSTKQCETPEEMFDELKKIIEPKKSEPIVIEKILL